METKQDPKPTVKVRIPDGLSLSEALDCAGRFAYASHCKAEFDYGVETIVVWYNEFTHGDGWKAIRNEMPIERDHGRWGKLVEP
jgi:hypothetical protein